MARTKRQGIIPGTHISLEVAVSADDAGKLYVCSTEYTGPLSELLAANCISPTMMQSRESRRKGSTKPNLDDHGGSFTLHRLASTAHPDRMVLKRHISNPAIVIDLPGVRDLFPEGFHALVPSLTSIPPRSCTKSDSNVTLRAEILTRRLMKRYRGVKVDVRFNDHPAGGHGTYRGWCVSFESPDPNVLVRHRLAPILDANQSLRSSEFVGVHQHAHGPYDATKCWGVAFHIEEDPHTSRADPAMTKKMQVQVNRLLKPFVRGTWKPGTELSHG